MTEASAVSDLPNRPAVYSMHGGRGGRTYVAYVGIADALRRRVTQHLVNRDSSVTTGTAAAGLRPDYVTEVRWWEHPNFSSRPHLEAAEHVAFEVLDPALRSRGAISDRATKLLDDHKFVRKMRTIFESEPTGRLIVFNLDRAIERIADLERRVAHLETQLGKGGPDSRGSK